MATIEDVTRTVRTVGDSWHLGRKLRRLVGEDEQLLARLLWQARKAGTLPIESAHHTLALMPGAPEVWEADDLIALLHDLQAAFPNGRSPSGGWIHHSGLPGSADGLCGMMMDKADDAAFGAAMAARWTELADLWGTTVAYFLVAHGQLPFDALPDEKKALFARLWLRSGGLYEMQRFQQNVPATSWGRCLAREAASPDSYNFHQAEYITTLWPHADEAQRIAALARLGHEDRGGAITSPAIKEQLDTLDDGWLDRQIAIALEDAEVQPLGVLLQTRARRLLRTGQPWPDALDAPFIALIDRREMTFALADSELAQLFLTLPEERRVALLSGRAHPNWVLVEQGRSAASAQLLLSQLHAAPNHRILHDYAFGSRTPWPLAPFVAHIHEQVGAYFGVETRHAHRARYLEIMAASGDPLHLPHCFAVLDKTRGPLRATALRGAVGCGMACLPFIEERLNAGKKGLRSVAIEVMLELPPHETLHALAQQRLAKERVAALQEQLGRIRSPDSAGSSGLVEALVASKLGAWEQHREDDNIVGALWEALSQLARDTRLEPDDPVLDHWLAAVKGLPRSEELFSRVFEMIPVVAAAPAVLLQLLDERYPERLPGALRTLAGEKTIQRPAGFGRAAGGPSHFDFVRWMLDQLRPDLVLPLLAALTRVSKGRRTWAMQQMSQQGAVLRPGYERALTDPEKKVRALAIELLDPLAGPDSLPAVRAAMQAHPRDTALSALAARIEALSLDIESFPETAAGDAALDAALAQLPAPEAGWTLPPQRPRLCWARGAELSPAAERWFLRTLSQETVDNREPKLGPIRSRLDDARCVEFAAAIRPETDRSRRRAPFIMAATLLGSDESLAEVAQKLALWVRDAGASYGRDALQGLMRRGTPAAIRAIEWASRKSRSHTIRRRCADALVELAGWHDISVSELLDHALSDFGFDSDGLRTIAYGPRTLTLKLGPDNRLLIIDDKGQVRTSPPAARRSEDASVIKAAKKRISALRRELKAVQTAQRRRMEGHLASQRVWRLSAWRTRFLQHPIMLAFTRTLVWEAVDADHAPGVSFVVTAEGELIDAEADDIDIDGAHGVRLLHPLGHDRAVLEGWSKVLLDSESEPLFPQLSRETWRAEGLPETDALLFNRLPSITAGQFLSRSRLLGYEQGSRGDGGDLYRSSKQLGPWFVTIEHDEIQQDLYDARCDVKKLVVRKGGEEVPWRTLPEVLVSELLRDLHQLSGPRPRSSTTPGS